MVAGHSPDAVVAGLLTVPLARPQVSQLNDGLHFANGRHWLRQCSQIPTLPLICN
jgi:hypothetical protein